MENGVWELLKLLKQIVNANQGVKQLLKCHLNQQWSHLLLILLHGDLQEQDAGKQRVLTTTQVVDGIRKWNPTNGYGLGTNTETEMDMELNCVNIH